MKKLIISLLIMIVLLSSCTPTGTEPEPKPSEETPAEPEPTPPEETPAEPEPNPTDEASGDKHFVVHSAPDKSPSTLEEVQALRIDKPLSDETIQAIKNFMQASTPLLLSGEKNDNYSPLSLYLALAMASTGAEAESQAEIIQALQLENPDDLADQMGLIMERLNVETSEGRIRLANSIWNQYNFPFEKDYIQTLNDKFQASLFEVDFKSPEAGEQMSQWVSEKTEGLIQPEFDDTSDFISVLFNALYFKESWLAPFQAELTKPDTFRGIEGESEKDFLHSSDKGMYISHEGVEGMILPFEYSRMILLKKSGSNPMDILKDYSLDDLTASASLAMINLKLPKFEYSNEYNLKEMLEGLGMSKVFDPDEADFSGISPEPLFISDILQDSFISLDEDGVEAAAVTTIGFGTTSIIDKQVELAFDEPFLFVIESPEGLPLFVGTVTK
ncbi:MAG TPA: hypothetical protein GXZ74_00105 [Tissierellia bacterium]|nr:hypothetical protein [Tissierellia bacterium]